jgi:hypothetical protein
VNGQLGVREVHVPAARFLDAAADLPLDFRRGQRKTLVGSPGRDPERARIRGIEVGQDGARDLVHVERRAPGPGEVADAEDAAEALADRGPVGRRPEDDLDAPHQHADLPDVQIGHGLAQVPHESRDEPRAVLPLERDLLVVDDD